LFSDDRGDGRDLLGGKGASLAEMTALDMPVPPGFTITTEACRIFLTTGEIPTSLWDEVDAAMAILESRTGKRFGNPACPLLVSVRSGGATSMPGMMDTVLNVGLNEATAVGLARMTDASFAVDTCRRFVPLFGRVVLGHDDGHGVGEAAASRAESNGKPCAATLESIVPAFREMTGALASELPREPREQLHRAILAVFRSWHSPRAVAYRRAHGIADDLGTAATVQAMVFGNMGNDSATGVVFTRDPNTGHPGLFGEYLPNAQGEDIVAGSRTPLPLAAMAADPVFRPAHEQLQAIAAQLERHYQDMQDLEFTIERGRLWMLQARAGKRTAQAAVRIACDLANQGVIDRATAVNRVSPAQVEQLFHPQLDETRPLAVIARGLPASPGAASGRVVFDVAEARQRGEAGEAVILVRIETTAADFPGMERAVGLLTARGGRTSHAAVVARGMGKPAVTGCSALTIDAAAGLFRAGSTVVRAGDLLTIDGASGRVILGQAATVEPAMSGPIETLLAWADGFRRLRVRTNADTPGDAKRARELGAEGIGLCRTEHMFGGEGRLDAMRALILAGDDVTRATALARLEAFQVADFTGIFRAMAGLPCAIRTLDPPLHEFLPSTEAEIARLAATLGLEEDAITARVEELRETNPMLGHRGCRLGLTFPEITRMQARAIYRAALDCLEDGVDVAPEVIIPLVSHPEELRRQRAVVIEEAEALFAVRRRRIPLKVGAMIELPRAALIAGELAMTADFFSFGTNDLTQATGGLSRDDAGGFLPLYLRDGVFPADPFEVLDLDGVGALISLGVERGRRSQARLTTGVCGEHAGDPTSIAFFHAAGLDYISCSPFRLPVARLAAAQAALAGHVVREVAVDQPRSFAAD
jgi:pyruvate,orthophosphate dikinase